MVETIAWSPSHSVTVLTTSTERSTVSVAATRQIADGVCEVTLSDPSGRRLPDWTPGSHIDLVLPGDLVRQYSLCGERRDAYSYRVAVLRAPAGRGGSAAVHEQLRTGDLIGIGGPRNNFRLVPAPHYLFVAGGIGITPILAMVAAAEAMGASWQLLYGGRTRESMAYLDEVARYGDRVEVVPQNEAGHMDLAGAVDGLPEGSLVYCCGPAPLLDAIEVACAHLPAGSLRTERFVAREQPVPVRSTSFEVELASSGTVLTVEPGETIVDVLDRAGAPVLTSCRQGVCGTCETGVLAGIPDHRDTLLGADERRVGDCLLPCVSRSCSDRLVLDL